MDGRKSAGQRPLRTEAASLKKKPSSSRDIVSSGQQLAKPQAAPSLSASKHSVTRSFDKISVEQRTTVTNSTSKKIEKQRVHQQASGSAPGHNVQASRSQQHVTKRTTARNSGDSVKIVTEKHVKHKEVCSVSGWLPTTMAGSSSHSVKIISEERHAVAMTVAKQQSVKRKPGGFLLKSSQQVKKH